MAGKAGKSGRKRKPTQILKLSGGYRADRRPRDEVEVKTKRPPMPKFLKGEAKDEWNRIVELLVDNDLVTELDMAALAMYCQEWKIYYKLCEKLWRIDQYTTKTSNGNLIQHPLVGAKNKAFSNLLAICREFGFSPSARSSLGGNTKPNEVDDPLKNLIQRNIARQHGHAG